MKIKKLALSILAASPIFLLNTAQVIPPFLIAFKSRGYAAIAIFCLGGMPPIAVFGRSLL